MLSDISQFAALLSCLAAVAYAAEQQVIPEGGRSMFAEDGISGFRVGARDKSIGKGERIEVEGMPFKHAMRVVTLVRPKITYAIQLRGVANGGITKGDVCLLAFWMRGPQSEDESGDGVARAHVQRMGAPYEKIGSLRATAGQEWRQVFVPFRAKKTLPAGKTGVTFHLGHRPQTVEIGGVRLINYGRQMDLKSLPVTKATYKGRAADAPWRTTAAERIEKFRKADLAVRVVDAAGRPVSGATVQVKMKRHAFGFGSAVVAKYLCVDDDDARRYRRVIEQNYNKVVFENDLKWWAWEQAKSNTHRTFRKEWRDRALAWLNERDIEVRGHYITWAPLKPPEVRKYKGKAEQLRKDLFAHMEEEVPDIGERVGEWDVVNHIVGWGTTLSTLLGGDSIYVDIVKRSRQLAPKAELWINEGQLLPGGSRRQAYEKMAKYLIANEAAPDGIGFMGHFGATSLTSPAVLYDVLDRFAKIIPNLQLTEFDVRVGSDEELQADYLRDVMTVAFSHPAVQAVVMWGFWEGRHWKPDAALYRRDWSLKPAGQAWQDLVFEQWWTDESGKTGRDGVCKTRGFLGEYEIVATYRGTSKTLKTKLAKDGASVAIALD